MDDRHSPFVGRAPELARLNDAVAQTRDGSGTVMVIAGEPGIGKSRLVDEFVATARLAGNHVLRGWAAEHDRDRPFRVVLDAFRAEPDAVSEAALAAARLPSNHGALDGLIDVVEGLTADGTVAVVLEDLHWSDPHSHRFLVSLAARARSLPLVVVATTRPPPRGDDLDRSLVQLADLGAQLFRLDALTATEVDALAEALLGAPPGASLHEYLGGAGGNPLFVTELVSALRAEHSLAAGQHSIDIAEHGLPPPLRLTVLRRLDPLAAPVIEMLRLASLLGSSFTVRDLAAASGTSSAALLPLLDDALRAEVLVDQLERLAFRHDVLRDSIYQDIPLSARRALHREFADALLAADADVSTIAEHLALGAEPGDTRAVEWLVNAASSSASDFVGLPLLERARSLCAPRSELRPTILTRLAFAYAFMGRLHESTTAALEALALDPPAEVAAQAAAALASTDIIAGRIADGIEKLLAIGSCAQYPLADRATAQASGAYFSVFALEPDKAVDRARTALAMIGDEHWPMARSNALQALALGTMASGDARDALALAQQARDGAVETTSEGVTLALIAMLCNELDVARAAVEADLLSLGGTGNEGTRPILHYCMAMAHYLAGDLDAAVAEAITGQTLSEELGTGLARTFGQAAVALVAVHRDDMQAAGDQLAIARDELEKVGIQFGVDLLLLAQARHASAIGNDDLARMWLVGAWEFAGQVRALSMAQLIAPELLAALVGHDNALAHRIVGEVDELAARNPAPALLGIAHLGRAMIQRDGDLALASVDAHERAAMVIPHARVCELAADVLVATGNTKAATSSYVSALDTWESAGATREESRINAKLRSIGVRRRRATATRRASFGWEALTATELKVATLVAEGHTSKEIGERLFISRRTVETHLSHIFTKLGVANRAQVAAIVAAR